MRPNLSKRVRLYFKYPHLHETIPTRTYLGLDFEKSLLLLFSLSSPE